MFSTKLKTAALALVTAGLFAGSAQAAVIDTDDVKLTSTGYDFGSSGFALGAPTGSGEIHFHLESGQIRPHVLGTLHLNDADGTCARMRLRYFNDAGTQIQERFGGTVCADDDAHHAFSVDLDPYSDAAIDSVNVAVMQQTATGEFVATSSTHVANTFSDSVKITEDGVDFGSSGFALGAPTGSGSVSWGLDEGIVTPHLTGTLHLNNSSGVCARMNIHYLAETGAFITEKPGGTVCGSDNGHHAFSVDLDPFESNKVGKVTIQLQTQGTNGSFSTAGSATVSISG
jgi:hypothetical protein